MSLYGAILRARRAEFDQRVWALHKRFYSEEYIAKHEGCTVDEVISSLRRTRSRMGGGGKDARP